jgi:hypothetical protein
MGISRRTRIITVIVVFAAGISAGALAARHSSDTTPAKSAATTKTTSVAKTGSEGNAWKGKVDPTAIPLGDGKVSTTPKTGYVDSCTTNFRGGGAEHAGSWINDSQNTWNSKTKVAVEGNVHWSAASYSVKTSGSHRIVTTNDLPQSYPTGVFPISSGDQAYQYDRNPNRIAAQDHTYTLPLNPKAAATPNCTSLGAIGVLSDGVLLFNGLDAAGRDAVAHETQDSCNGHPDGQEEYHYHNVPSCIRDAARGSSTLVGYALDGYGIYVERDSKGNLPTNADLDVCHGRTSEVTWNGKKTKVYHYDATLEYPYTIGCFHGTPVATPRAGGGPAVNRSGPGRAGGPMLQ